MIRIIDSFLERVVHILHDDEEVVNGRVIVAVKGGGEDVKNLGGENILSYLAQLTQNLNLAQDLL